MPGTLRIAYKLLVNDRAKFAALLLGITFAVLLMILMTSLFAGVLARSSATVTNIGARVWVLDPAVQTVSAGIPMPTSVLERVKSIDGVAFAVPLYLGSGQVKLRDGSYRAVSIIGLDDTSLFGRPPLLQGNIDDIYAENGFIVVKDTEYHKLGSPLVGAEFEINDHRGVIVGIAEATTNGLFGIPTLYTTYSRALQYLPNARNTLSYVLVEPKSPADVPVIQRQVAGMGYLALTREEFIERISNFYKYQTGMGINLFLMTAISFIVGLSISGQTFYTFILENLDKFGALKAIGAKGRDLVSMILFQAAFTALTGYGLGVGLCALFIGLAKLRLPSYASMITYANIGLALVMVTIIAGVSGYIGVRKVLRIEPFDVFRG